MNQKRLAVLFLALAIGAIAYWVLDGGLRITDDEGLKLGNVFTRTESRVEVVDPLWGTKTEEWRPDFEPGLDLAAPFAFVMFAGAVWLLRRSRKNFLHEDGTVGTAGNGMAFR